MTTCRLPINVLETKNIEKFYQKALENNKLGVCCYSFFDISIEKIHFLSGSTESN